MNQYHAGATLGHWDRAEGGAVGINVAAMLHRNP
jgi:hypothetical protein